jgi:putative lipoic acid-binding regulatory protein
VVRLMALLDLSSRPKTKSDVGAEVELETALVSLVQAQSARDSTDLHTVRCTCHIAYEVIRISNKAENQNQYAKVSHRPSVAVTLPLLKVFPQ